MMPPRRRLPFNWKWSMAIQSDAIWALQCPSNFERLMEQVLLGLPASIVLVYLDDIIVPGHTFSHQTANLRCVFECLRKAKLKLSRKKCTLFKTEVKYLGHTVSRKGIAPDPSKVEAVARWPRPTTASEIKALCAFICRDCTSSTPASHSCAIQVDR